MPATQISGAIHRTLPEPIAQILSENCFPIDSALKGILKDGSCPEWRFLKVFLLLSIRVVGPESMFLGLPIFLRNRHSGHDT
jgi:hypothetical protein